jgi:CubicO group peptidase (beta-lactamase class C family)
MKTGKKVVYGALIFFLLVLAGAAVYINSLLPIVTGYAAKNLCSDVFVSGRQPSEVESTDLNFSLIKYTRNNVDFDEKSVSSRFLWKKSKAIYREGFGVTLINDVSEKTLREEVFPEKPESGYSPDTIPWPLGNVVKDSVTGINAVCLGEITKRLVTGNAYSGNAFAFIVLHKGIPVAEAYKPQFSQKTRFLSWSMAKSFTNAITGILVMDGKMDISLPAGIDEWKNDERRKITVNDLLQMQSGLKWNEDYGSRSDINLMLHDEGDMAKYAYDQPSEFPAGTHWYYSSGTANIITYLIKGLFPDDSSYYSYVYDRFFNRIGIPDAVFEVDPSGNFVGSSYLYATARDYARFGLLYLNDGILNGERILPEGWVKYSTTPASESNGEYGALFWLNICGKYPSAPADMYSCQGHDGQMIFIIPSKELVVVVLGYSPVSKGGMDFDRLLKDILETLPGS